ncbi:hypothetical protein LTS10_009081 [Elasticomyces elasticus]|nr:hypothetical protein LTS10_009081 [Elasticomyces elasticus]
MQNFFRPRSKVPSDDESSEPNDDDDGEQEEDEDDDRDMALPYVEEWQQRILTEIDRKDYLAVLERIDELEREVAPSYHLSRIGSSGAWKSHGLFLLMSADIRVLRAAIDGTLPQLALGDLKNAVRKPAIGVKSWQDKLDPVIYLNFIADKWGLGLTRAEMLRFTYAYEIAAGLRDDPRREYWMNGKDVCSGVRDIFNRLRKGKKRVDFYDTVKVKDSMATIVERLVAYFRDVLLPAAEAADVDHVMFKAECGWSIKGYERCEVHEMLDESSPAGFRLARLVLVHMFPTRGFERLHQFVLFDVVTPEQSGIGESIGHVMCGSYSKDDVAGGFNICQAGISVTAAWEIRSDKLREHRATALDRGYFKKLESNIESALQEVDAEDKELHVYESRRRVEIGFSEEVRQFENGLPALAADLRAEEASITKALVDVRELDVAYGVAAEASRQQLQAAEAMDEYAALMSELVEELGQT